MTDERVAEQLTSLQASFTASLPDKVAHLERLVLQCVRAMRSEREVPDAFLREIHLEAHSLAGSGGTFGHAELSEAASTLESLLNATLKNGTPVDRSLVERLEQAMAAVRLAGQQAAAAPINSSGVAALSPVVPGRRERMVFVVDRDSEAAVGLLSQLAHFGFKAKVFSSLADADAVSVEKPPVAMLVDSSFLDDALARCQSLAEDVVRRLVAVPIYYMSTQSDFSTRLAAVRAGGAAFFSRPVDIGVLVNALDALVGLDAPEPYRILIVEDSESTAAFYKQILLAAGMSVSVVNDPSQITVPLNEFAPDLILMDFYLPVCNGIELASLIRQQVAFDSVPIVFLSVLTDVNQHLLALREGGDDFLCKPIDPVVLVSVVTSRAARGRVLRAHMSTDGLTGLFDHSHLKEQLQTEILRSQRQGRPLVYAMLDIDHFKRVNDTWGHAVGDGVLRSLAKLLRQRLRRTDVAGRYGGEEFGLILSDIDAPTALSLLEDIRRDFAALQHVSREQVFHVTLSAGVAEYPRHQTVDDLVRAADAALYVAKQGGRDRVVVDGHQVNERASSGD